MRVPRFQAKEGSEVKVPSVSSVQRGPSEGSKRRFGVKVPKVPSEGSEVPSEGSEGF